MTVLLQPDVSPLVVEVEETVMLDHGVVQQVETIVVVTVEMIVLEAALEMIVVNVAAVDLVVGTVMVLVIVMVLVETIEVEIAAVSTVTAEMIAEENVDLVMIVAESVAAADLAVAGIEMVLVVVGLDVMIGELEKKEKLKEVGGKVIF